MPAGSETEIFEYDIWLPENLARMPLGAENMNPGR